MEYCLGYAHVMISYSICVIVKRKSKPGIMMRCILTRFVLIACICLQEDMGEHVVQGDAHPGHVGTACLLSSSFAESGKDNGVATLPIMGRNSRQTIGKVRGKILHKRIPSWLTMN